MKIQFSSSLLPLTTYHRGGAGQLGQTTGVHAGQLGQTTGVHAGQHRTASQDSTGQHRTA